MKVALIQANVKIGDPDQNFTNIEKLMTKAIEKQSDMIVLPEMWNSGYALEKADEVADLNGERTKEFLSSFAKKNSVMIIGGSTLTSSPQ